MARIEFRLKGTVQSRGDASPLLEQPGDAVLVERGHPRWLVMKCPDGCGDEIPINLDSAAGPAWRLYRSPNLGLTLYPSVWRDTGCEAHFIVWRDNILLLGGWDDSDYETFWEDKAFGRLREAVLNQLPAHALTHFSTIADELEELPWDVLKACRQLVKNGLAVEGKKRERQHFGRK